MKSKLYILLVFLVAPPFFVSALLLKAFTFGFDKKGIHLHKLTRVWALFYLYTFPNLRSISVLGKEHLNPNETYLIISNHLSNLDIMVGFALPHAFKWVSKRELGRLPFIGWNMLLNNYILLERNCPKSIKKMMSKCITKLNEGSSVFLFPEGTRSQDGNLGTFKAGAFIIAKKANCNILPVVIRNTHKVLPKSSLKAKGKQDIIIEILPPITAHTIAEKSPKELLSSTQEMYKQALAK